MEVTAVDSYYCRTRWVKYKICFKSHNMPDGHSNHHRQDQIFPQTDKEEASVDLAVTARDEKPGSSNKPLS